MSIKQLFLTICLFGLCVSLPAQSKKFIKAYVSGQDFFNKKSYSEARSFFQAALNYPEENPLKPNAYYYLALADLKNGELTRAADGFRVLLERYPNWEQQDELYYNLAEIAFAQKDDSKALAYLNKIRSPRMFSDIRDLMGHYVKPLSIAQLRLLQQSFPEDTLLSRMLIDKIAANSQDSEEVLFMQELIEKFELTPERRLVKRVNYIRKPYKIGVLLPFNYYRLQKQDTNTLSRISIQMYQAVRLAVKELDSLYEVPLDLIAYDIPRDSSHKIQDLLLNGEFDDMDLLIGPLFDQDFTSLASLASIKKIHMVNPISFNADLAQNDFTYLFYPSRQTQAEQVIQFAQEKSPGKGMIILYDNLSRNQQIAELYRQAAEKRGIQVLAYEELNTFDSERLRNVLNKVDVSSLGGILSSNTSELTARRIMDEVQKLREKVALYVPEEWHKFRSIDESKFENQAVYFIDPDYWNEYSLEMVQFASAFKDFARKDPNKYAFAGYEITRYFADLFQKFGVKSSLRSALRETSSYGGILSEGISHQESTINTHVPILQFSRGDLKPINSLSKNK